MNPNQLPSAHPTLVGVMIGMSIAFLLCKLTDAYDASLPLIILPLVAAGVIFVIDLISFRKFFEKGGKRNGRD